MNKPEIKRGLDVVVCYPENNDLKVLPMRTGSDGSGASAVEMGVLNFDTAHDGLAHRLHWHSDMPILMSVVGEIVVTLGILGFVYFLFSFLFKIFFSVFKEDHSLMGGVMIHGQVDRLECRGLVSCCICNTQVSERWMAMLGLHL